MVSYSSEKRMIYNPFKQVSLKLTEVMYSEGKWLVLEANTQNVMRLYCDCLPIKWLLKLK